MKPCCTIGHLDRRPDYDWFFGQVQSVFDRGCLHEQARYPQHGTTSTLVHSIAVAFKAYELACFWGVGRQSELVRAALLHDYYLYDWHDPASGGPRHAFGHPKRALRRALVDYPELTERERDAIKCHMFPLVPEPPLHRIGWLVTLADKICASKETAVRSGEAHARVRRLCALHCPTIPLAIVDGRC